MTGGKVKGLSVRAFAKELGVDEKSVRERIKKGKRIAEAILDDGSLDPDRARALWWVDFDSRQVRTRARDATPDPKIVEAAREAMGRNKVKDEQEAVALELARIKLDREKGNSIDREAARRAASAFARMQRDAILAFANREGPGLAAKWGVPTRVVVADLDAALRNLLVDMAEQPVPFEEASEKEAGE